MQQPERKVEPLPAPDRLDSWKEIAAYLNRSERTVRRWEAREELPVHRLQHDKRGSVYAYTRELDAWHASRRLTDEARVDAPAKSRIRWWIAGAAVLVGLAAAVGLRGRSADRTVAETRGTSNEEAWQLYRRAYFADNAGRVQIETGIRYYQQAMIGSVPFTLGDLGFVLAAGGHRGEAGRLLQELNVRRDRGYYPTFPIAEIELGLGNTEAALAWLERAVEERHTGFYLPSADPVWNAISGHAAIPRTARIDGSAQS